VLLVPVDAAWKTIAYAPGLVVAGDATPSLAQVAAVARRWEERYGARIATIGPARVEWYLARRPNRREALALALELLVFAPDADDGTIEDVAAALRVDRTFMARWD